MPWMPCPCWTVLGYCAGHPAAALDSQHPHLHARTPPPHTYWPCFALNRKGWDLLSRLAPASQIPHQHHEHSCLYSKKNRAKNPSGFSHEEQQQQSCHHPETSGTASD